MKTITRIMLVTLSLVVTGVAEAAVIDTGLPYTLSPSGSSGGSVTPDTMHASTNDLNSLTAGSPFDHSYILTMHESHGLEISGTYAGMAYEDIYPGFDFISISADLDGDGLDEVWRGSGGGVLSTGSFNILAGDVLQITISGFVAGSVGDYKFRVFAAPIPAAVWLFGSALIGLIGIGRGRRGS
jgi:hypothetical protein